MHIVLHVQTRCASCLVAQPIAIAYFSTGLSRGRAYCLSMEIFKIGLILSGLPLCNSTLPL